MLLRLKRDKKCKTNCLSVLFQFLADRTNGRTYATVLRPSVVVVCRLPVTLCIVIERCVLEQKLLHVLTAYRKSYMRSRLIPK